MLSALSYLLLRSPNYWTNEYEIDSCQNWTNEYEIDSCQKWMNEYAIDSCHYYTNEDEMETYQLENIKLTFHLATPAGPAWQQRMPNFSCQA